MNKYPKDCSKKLLIFTAICFCLLTVCYCYENPTGINVKPNSLVHGKSNVDNGFKKPVGWVDPFDMGMSGSSHEEYDLGSNVDFDNYPPDIGWKNHNRREEGDTGKRSVKYGKFIIFQRFTNVFLRALALKDSPYIVGSQTVQLDLTISGDDLKILQSFGSIGEQAASIERVSEIINNIFTHSQSRSTSFKESLSEMYQWSIKTLLKVIGSPELTIVTLVTSMLFAILWLVFVTKSYRLALFCVFFMIFFAGFGFTWLRMIEEQEIERYYDSLVHGSAPYHCKGNPLSWSERVYYYWFGEDCLKFYKKRDVRPVLKISPTEVLSITISTMFIEPGQNIGKAYGNFINGMIRNLPWYTLPIALPLAFIIPLLFFVVCFAICFDYQLKFSITSFHLLPSWTGPAIQRHHSNYVEDLSDRDKNMLNSKDIDKYLSDSKTPLFIMNFPAVKKMLDLNKVVEIESDKASNTAKTGTGLAEKGSDECQEEIESVLPGRASSSESGCNATEPFVASNDPESSVSGNRILSTQPGDKKNL